MLIGTKLIAYPNLNHSNGSKLAHKQLIVRFGNGYQTDQPVLVFVNDGGTALSDQIGWYGVDQCVFSSGAPAGVVSVHIKLAKAVGRWQEGMGK